MSERTRKFLDVSAGLMGYTPLRSAEGDVSGCASAPEGGRWIVCSHRDRPAATRVDRPGCWLQGAGVRECAQVSRRALAAEVDERGGGGTLQQLDRVAYVASARCVPRTEGNAAPTESPRDRATGVNQVSAPGRRMWDLVQSHGDRLVYGFLWGALDGVLRGFQFSLLGGLRPGRSLGSLPINVKQRETPRRLDSAQ